MGNVNDIYNSAAWLKAENLEPGKDVPVTVSSVEVIDVERESDSGGTYMAKQIVLHFEESDKKLGLNKTNTYAIAGFLLEDDFEKWVGARITLYQTKTSFGSKMVDCIRVKGAEFPEAVDKDAPF